MPDVEPLHDYSKSRAVLIGTSEYNHLPPVGAAANSLNRMLSLLTGALCGWPKGRVLVVANELKPGDLPDRLVTAFEDIADFALFYYVGHGQIDMEGQLCLSLVDSVNEANRRTTTSLSFQAVRRALLGSKATTKIVILDCCFSGLATRPANTLAAPDDLLDKTACAGAYTMAACGADATAWFETGTEIAQPQTFFTKYLADVVEAGIRRETHGLQLHPLFLRVQDKLATDGRPVPGERNVDHAHQFVFARNAAPPEPHQDLDAQLRRLMQRLDEAEARDEARRRQEHAEFQALEETLSARNTELTAQVEQLREQLHGQAMDVAQQRELQDAIQMTDRRLTETAAVERRAHENVVRLGSPDETGADNARAAELRAWGAALARSAMQGHGWDSGRNDGRTDDNVVPIRSERSRDASHLIKLYEWVEKLNVWVAELEERPRTIGAPDAVRDVEKVITGIYQRMGTIVFAESSLWLAETNAPEVFRAEKAAFTDLYRSAQRHLEIYEFMLEQSDNSVWKTENLAALLEERDACIAAMGEFRTWLSSFVRWLFNPGYGV